MVVMDNARDLAVMLVKQHARTHVKGRALLLVKDIAHDHVLEWLIIIKTKLIPNKKNERRKKRTSKQKRIL